MKDRPERLYEIQYTKAAEKFLKDHEDVRSKFRDAIRAFLDGARPENADIKKIRGKRNDYYRLRLGGCRVVYAVINGKIIVIKVILAGARGDVYKKTSGLK